MGVLECEEREARCWELLFDEYSCWYRSEGVRELQVKDAVIACLYGVEKACEIYDLIREKQGKSE